MDKKTFKAISRKVNSKNEHKVLILYMGAGKTDKRHSIEEISQYLKLDVSYVSFLLGRAFSNFTYAVVTIVTPDLCLREVDFLDSEIKTSLYGGYVMGVASRLHSNMKLGSVEILDSVPWTLPKFDWL